MSSEKLLECDGITPQFPGKNVKCLRRKGVSKFTGMRPVWAWPPSAPHDHHYDHSHDNHNDHNHDIHYSISIDVQHSEQLYAHTTMSLRPNQCNTDLYGWFVNKPSLKTWSAIIIVQMVCRSLQAYCLLSAKPHLIGRRPGLPCFPLVGFRQSFAAIGFLVALWQSSQVSAQKALFGGLYMFKVNVIWKWGVPSSIVLEF